MITPTPRPPIRPNSGILVTHALFEFLLTIALLYTAQQSGAAVEKNSASGTGVSQ